MGDRTRWGKVDLRTLCRVTVEAGNMAGVVYAYLCCHANGDGWAWPKQEHIAHDLCCSTPTVRRALDALQRLGVVERGEVTSDRGVQRKLQNAYRVAIS